MIRLRKTVALLLAAACAAGLTACAKPQEATDETSSSRQAETASDAASAESGAITCGRCTIRGETTEAPAYDYVLLPDQTARIVRYNGRLRDLAVPENVDGYPVSELGERLASGGNNTSVTLSVPDCVTVIRPNAFGDLRLAIRFEVSDTHPTLQVTDGMLICPAEKRIIRGFFSKADYVIPEGIETIDDYAFFNCIPKSIAIPESVSHLGRNPFAFCCSDMDTYTVLQDVTLSPDNTALEIRDGALFSLADHRLVWCFASFYSDSFAESPEYSIPEGTEIIDDFALRRWSRLESVTIPASVTRIGANPFISMNPEAIRLADGNTALEYRDQMLLSLADHRLVCAGIPSDSVSVPQGTEIIGDYAFTMRAVPYGNTIVLPDSVTAIGAYAFGGCNLSDVRIPAGIREIGDYAFYRTSSAGELAFDGCVRIGEGASAECFYVTRLAVHGSARIGAGAFTASGLEEVILEAGPSRIGESAFSTCRHLKKITLPEGLTTIERNTFMNCPELAEISLPESLSYIGSLYNSSNSSGRVLTYECTMHATVTKGSYAEQYCIDNGIEYSCR